MNQRWTPTDLAFVEENAERLTDKVAADQLSAKIGRHISVNAYRKKRQALGRKKAHGRGISRVVNSKVENITVCPNDISQWESEGGACQNGG